MKSTNTKQIIIRITVIIALAELAIMALLRNIPFNLNPYTIAIIDAALLVAVSTPIIFIYIIKPYLVTHEARIANILQNTNDAYITLDKEWIITYVNPVAKSLLNIQPDRVTGLDLRDALPDMVSMFYKILKKTFTTQTAQKTTVLFGPTMKYLEAHSCPTEEGLIINFRDITLRRKSEDELRTARKLELEGKQKVKLAIELASYMKAINQHALVSVTDAAGNIIEVNEKFCLIAGYSRQELIGHNHNIINSGTHSNAFFSDLWTTITSGRKWHGELCNRAKNGHLYWVDSTIVPITDEAGVIERYISVRIDITERKHQENQLNIAYQDIARVNSELQRISRIDGLTNIANRRYFDETLTVEINKHRRSSRPLTLLLCDIDYFKNYNDTYGHPAGDICLQKVAQAIDSSFSRAGDLVARYGGEEFAVILPNIEQKSALLLAEKMRENVAQLNLPHSASAVASMLTISVGVISLVPDKDTLAAMMLEKADKALYMAKQQGRNNVQYFVQDDSEILKITTDDTTK